MFLKKNKFFFFIRQFLFCDVFSYKKEEEKSVISSLLCVSLIQFDMTNTVSKEAATLAMVYG
jgi:hypothetical protein